MLLVRRRLLRTLTPMRLLRLRLAAVDPFVDVSFPFSDDDATPRSLTVIVGAGGVGKTTILNAIASTRPGNASVLQRRSPDTPADADAEMRQPEAICDWLLGDDDPERPHPLVIAGPNVKVHTKDESESIRRREQAVFDRVARDGGHAFLLIPSTRWFSRQPVALSAPARTVARYDVRTPTALDDRTDLARETKQAMAYAAISAALPDLAASKPRGFELLGAAMTRAVDEVVGLARCSYLGLDPQSFEPLFREGRGTAVSFDSLPTRVRHLVALVALPVRMLWGAYPGSDPRMCEGVVAIDEVDLHQDPVVQAGLGAALRRALPRVQWIVTTTSPVVASSADSKDVLALRRLGEANRVDVYVGDAARTH